jgi:hypothetical protein
MSNHGRYELHNHPHDCRLERVLQTFQEKGLTLNKSKCKFNAKEIEFLGHKISAEGIRPTENNVQAVKEFRAPENVSEVRSFLGLTNFVSKFINDYSSVTEPLRYLTRKGIPFTWGKEQAAAFAKLKELISGDLVLDFYDMTAPLQVIVDASPVGLGAVMVQLKSEGPRVVKYISKALTEVEKRYSQTEKEALAIVWACEKLHLYLYGREFYLITDHQPLEIIYGPRSRPSARIERWVL